MKKRKLKPESLQTGSWHHSGVKERRRAGPIDAQSLEGGRSVVCLRRWLDPGLVARDNGPRHGNRMWDYCGGRGVAAIIDDDRGYLSPRDRSNNIPTLRE